jgi:hypothetical protein
MIWPRLVAERIRSLSSAKIRGVIARREAPRKDGAEFELQIGAAVPRQTELHDLPPEVAEAMNGYWDDKYVLVRDTMVIVDRNSRRIQFHALQQSTCEEIGLPSQVIVGRPGRLYTAIATFFHEWSVRATKK